MSIKGLMIIAGLALAVSSTSHAQQVEWKETLNLAKGLNMPPGVKADILGIELGATYDEAKAALNRLLAEAPPPPKPPQTQQQRVQEMVMRGGGDDQPLREVTTTLSLPVSNGPAITAKYVGQMLLRRDLPGSTNAKIREEIAVHLSAPSSGHQVFAVHRSISYPTQDDQPRISELLTALKEKLKGVPTVEKKSSNQAVYAFVFAKETLGAPADYARIECPIGVNTSLEQNIPQINVKRQCDVVMGVTATYGISNDHAVQLYFVLADAQWAKEDATADFAFFKNYIGSVQKRSGTAPKL